MRIVLDAGVGVAPARFVALWAEDSQASALGHAEVRPAEGEVFLPGLMEFVAIPLGVNLATEALIELVRRLVRRGRHPQPDGELEVVEVRQANGDRVVVVRLRTRDW
jgi:hypothetical protein